MHLNRNKLRKQKNKIMEGITIILHKSVSNICI